MQRLFFKMLAPLALGVCVFPAVSHSHESDTNPSTQATLKSVLSNRDIPLSMKMSQLDGSWRRFVVNDESNSQMQLLGAMAGLEFGVHFTKGQIVNMNDQTFLIAYKLPVKIDRRLINWHGHGEPPRPPKPDASTVLNLSLLNLKTMEGMNDVRPFDAKMDMSNSKQTNADSVRTLTQLGQGLLRYIRARGKFPALENPITWDAKRAFYPYVGDERLFMHPGTQQMYRYNEVLGGKKAAHIPNKQSFVVFYEAEASDDGTRGVLFMDGHVERLTPARWATIKKASKITDDGDAEEVAVTVETVEY